MTFSALLSLALENLNRRKGRVALTAIGVIIGTAAIIMLVSIGAGFQRLTTEQLTSFGDLTQITVFPGFAEGQTFGGTMQRTDIINDRALDDIAAIEGVDAVVPLDGLQGSAMLEFGRLESFANVQGVGTDDLTNLGYNVQEGTTFLARGTAIVGARVPEVFEAPNLRPGQQAPPPPDLLSQPLQLVLTRFDNQGNQVERSVQVRVVGILEQNGQTDFTVYMPLSDVTAHNEWLTGQRINRSTEGYNQVIVRVDDTTQVTRVAQQITEMGFQTQTLQQILQGFNTLAIGVQAVFGGVGAIALVVAAIGIANTMTMAILERTREIGLMKAVGASNRDVLSIFLAEAAGIGLIGGVGGIIIGWGVSQILNVVGLAFIANQVAQSGGGGDNLPSAAVVTPLWLVILAIVFSIIVGLLSGLLPALRAAAMEPISALKYE